MREFESPDPACLDQYGEPVSFTPADGGGPYEVTMIVSSSGPDADVQPAPVLVLFGTLELSGFIAASAPRPLRGDFFHVDNILYECYLVKQDRAGGTPGTNGTWCYLTQGGG